MPKLKPISFEPELNQRPKDSQHIIYSPPLYQLSYRRIGVHQNNKKFRKPDLLGFLREIRLRFVVNASEASTQDAPPFLLRPRGATVARLTPDQKVAVFKSRRGQVISYWREMSNMNGLFLSGDTKSEENGTVNAKVKTNLLRAWIEPAI